MDIRKALIAGTSLIVTTSALATMGIYSYQWGWSASVDSNDTYAAVADGDHVNGNSMLSIWFDPEDQCRASIHHFMGDQTKRYEKLEGKRSKSASSRMRVDAKPVVTLPGQISADSMNEMLRFVVRSPDLAPVVDQLKAGNSVTIAHRDLGAYSYRLRGSTVAINAAEKACRALMQNSL